MAGGRAPRTSTFVPVAPDEPPMPSPLAAYADDEPALAAPPAADRVPWTVGRIARGLRRRLLGGRSGRMA